MLYDKHTTISLSNDLKLIFVSTSEILISHVVSLQQTQQITCQLILAQAFVSLKTSLLFIPVLKPINGNEIREKQKTILIPKMQNMT